MVLSAWRSWRLGGSISDPGPADGLDKQSAGSRLAGLTERVWQSQPQRRGSV